MFRTISGDLISFLLIILMLSGISAPAASYADQIRISQRISESVFVAKDAEGYAKFSGEFVQYPGQFGLPAIPYRTISLLLPPDALPNTVTVSAENETFKKIPGYWDVRPTALPAIQEGTARASEVSESSGALWATDAFLPENLTGRVTTGRIHRYQIVDIPAALFQYHPVSHKLRRVISATFIADYKIATKTCPDLKRDDSNHTREERVKRRVANFAEMFPEYAARKKARYLSPQKRRYAVITTRSIATRSSRLSEFVETKKARGFHVSVITEDMWGGGTGDVAAENIRDWLMENYEDLRIQYLLLIGDPHPDTGDVPMKMLWPRNNAVTYPGYRESPSDYYYADLTGNWDLDGDGRYGEWEDDFGPGGIDRNYEVIVGRIPCYGDSTDELDHILTKIISYQNETDPSWRKNILLPMSPSDKMTPGYHLGEAVVNNLIPEGWGYHRVYDEDYDLFPAPETVICSENNVTNAWIDSQSGAVFWWTHGKQTLAENVMDRFHAAMLDDTHPAFVFQASCFNSYPEKSHNLSYALLRNGAVSSVAATRVSWYYPGETYFKGSNTKPGMAYEYAKRLITDGMKCGDALHDMKETLIPTKTFWMNFTAFCLYGDPELGLIPRVGDATGQDASPETGDETVEARKSKGIRLISPDNSDLRIGAVIHTEEKGPVEAVWQKGGEERTGAGHHVIWGHFFADPDDVEWGGRQNPDLFVKIWFDADGRTDVNFFHVSVPDIDVQSEMAGYEQKQRLTVDNRYVRHVY